MPHTHMLYDYTVAVYVVRKGRVLFIKKSQSDRWLPVGGHVSMDEDPEGAVLRLIDEQVGGGAEMIGEKPEFDDSKTSIAPSYMSTYRMQHPHQHITLIYFAVADTMKVSPADEDDEFSWIGMGELNDPAYGLSDSLIFYAQQALRERAGN